MAADSYCNGCIYKGVVENHLPCCNYIFMEDKMRPCPPGKGCTVKVEGKYKATVEERLYKNAQKSREYRAKLRAQRLRTAKCPICGQEFQTADSRKKFCSKKCYNTHRRRVWREREKMRREKNG